jgi:endonuclease/exonuclease/phosphatase family metal-dependent hydrolase
MSEVKEALLDLRPDIFAAQEVRDWDVFIEATSVLPRLTPVMVSRYRDSPKGGSLSIQQVGIASVYPSKGAWAEPFKIAEESPPRGFSFAALDVKGKTVLVYSVHLKANWRDQASDRLKREEAAGQLLRHAEEMERVYQPHAVLIAGDFNTDPTDERFASERTFTLFRKAGYVWPWEETPLKERITVPASGRFSDACFDGILVKAVGGKVRVVSKEPRPKDGVSDHYPVMLVVEIE